MWLLATVVIVALIGGYAYSKHNENDNQYQDAMELGAAHISNKEYAAAETAFEDALKQKPDDQKATTMLNQTQTFVSAQKLMKDNKFEDAQNDFEIVVDTKKGNDLLKNRAKVQLKKIEDIITNQKQFEEFYQDAKQQNDEGNYQESNRLLAKILEAANIKDRYYRDILAQAQDLKADNDAALAEQKAQKAKENKPAEPKATAPKEEEPEVTTPNVTGDKDAKLTESEQKAAKNYQGTNEYSVPESQNEINGQQITADQVTSARKAISAAGVNSNAMSDQDIKNAIKAAHEKGQSIGEYAKENFK